MVSTDRIRQTVARSMDVDGKIRERHTRHYADARESIPDTEWVTLVADIKSQFGVDLNDVADRGDAYKEEHGLDF